MVELIIFIAFVVVSLLFLIGHSVLPNPKAIVMICGFMFISIGIFTIWDGVSIGSTILKTSFTENIGLLISIFGLLLTFEGVFSGVKARRFFK